MTLLVVVALQLLHMYMWLVVYVQLASVTVWESSLAYSSLLDVSCCIRLCTRLTVYVKCRCWISVAHGWGARATAHVLLAWKPFAQCTYTVTTGYCTEVGERGYRYTFTGAVSRCSVYWACWKAVQNCCAIVVQWEYKLQYREQCMVVLTHRANTIQSTASSCHWIRIAAASLVAALHS